MAIEVVATTLVTEARSKAVSGSTSGESASYVNLPAELVVRISLPRVTAKEAPGNTLFATACSRIEIARSRSRAVRIRHLWDEICELIRGLESVYREYQPRP